MRVAAGSPRRARRIASDSELRAALHSSLYKYSAGGAGDGSGSDGGGGLAARAAAALAELATDVEATRQLMSGGELISAVGRALLEVDSPGDAEGGAVRWELERMLLRSVTFSAEAPNIKAWLHNAESLLRRPFLARMIVWAISKAHPAAALPAAASLASFADVCCLSVKSGGSPGGGSSALEQRGTRLFRNCRVAAARARLGGGGGTARRARGHSCGRA